MDLTQNKLTRTEWESIETPVSQAEKLILKLIIDGYDDVMVHSNNNLSMMSFVKIDNTSENEIFLYKKYFEELINNILKKYGEKSGYVFNCSIESTLKRMKSADNIRIQNLENNINQNKQYIYEFLLIDLCGDLLKYYNKKIASFGFYLYTLLQLKKTSIVNINLYVLQFVNSIISFARQTTNIEDVIENAYEFIEKNPYLLKYEDKTLFPHQKQIFSLCNLSFGKPKLILYTAPTGTGKTLTPIGLSNQYRIIFVCVARHIGIALAKSAISMEKKVAFAFGCETASDIRLHYFAAVNYIKHHKSGAIAKVDNSEGSKVEIMICDVQSYLTAMHYMIAFNKDTSKIITYWDEPTITMDYENHALHPIIHRNWLENKIPNIVLSCATLPKEQDIMPTIADFRNKFQDADVHTITSVDCKKSIPILNKDGFCVLPHTIYSKYNELIDCVNYCLDNLTLLRYFDLSEIVRFISYVKQKGYIPQRYSLDNYFDSAIENITMNSLKTYYLNLLIQIDSLHWNNIYNYMTTTQLKKFNNSIKKTHSMSSTTKQPETVLCRMNSVSNVTQLSKPTTTAASSGILITTVDAHTLTDGPTIFLTEDVKKIGSFYIQQSNIPSTVFQNILTKITKNNEIAQRISRLENLMNEQQNKTFDTTSRNHKSGGLIAKSSAEKDTSNAGNESDRLTKESYQYLDEINKARKEIRLVSLDPQYIPNTKPHQEVWSTTGTINDSAFVPTIDEYTTKLIMSLDIDNNLKVLLLLGIGMLLECSNVHYMEIMKELANTQKLFIIIASSDYVFGTNYAFAHGFIAKDMSGMSQSKTLQCLGRVGRANIQQQYTIRFRDDDMIKRLFTVETRNIEAENMSRLFVSE